MATVAAIALCAASQASAGLPENLHEERRHPVELEIEGVLPLLAGGAGERLPPPIQEHEAGRTDLNLPPGRLVVAAIAQGELPPPAPPRRSLGVGARVRGGVFIQVTNLRDESAEWVGARDRRVVAVFLPP